MIVVGKKYYNIFLVKELGINNTSNTSSTYIPYTESSDDVPQTHADFINAVKLEVSQQDRNLPHV